MYTGIIYVYVYYIYRVINIFKVQAVNKFNQIFNNY